MLPRTSAPFSSLNYKDSISKLSFLGNEEYGGNKMQKGQSLQINVEVKGIEEATKKAERLIELIKEAKTLADELASVEFDVDLKN